ncbi:MAG: ABC transporter ATP-binding protein [Chloroflexi bacterium]|nr:ABC transporter ATP-binding protein [Chloroflexota bacterium]
MSDPAILLHHVAAGYDGTLAIEGVDLEVQKGELVALVGANGSGKSTLLKVIVGLLDPRHGEVRVLGGEPIAARSHMSYLPQQEHVRWDFPLTVENVVLMGRVGRIGLGRGPGRSDRDEAVAALARVEAVYLRRRAVTDLSGGERQRVLLARALFAEPEILLLDEPATGVDPTTEEQLMSVLAEETAKGRTVLVATHDLASVMAHFERVVCMNHGIVAQGDVSILRDDAVLRATYGGHRPEPDLIADEHHA